MTCGQSLVHVHARPRGGSALTTSLAGLRGMVVSVSASWMNRPIGVKTADYQAF